ncbi:MAG: permease prefix domain 1-containing protein, partial [Acidimicrobiia bacterium]
GSIPEKRRSDVDRELRTAIDDAVEARIGQGEEPSRAETTVLTDLGDPARLAANYSDLPLYLIGPRFYLPWSRVIRKLLAVVPPLAGMVVVMVQILTGEGLVGAIFGGLWAGFIAAVNVVVWTTLGFAVAERAEESPAADLEPLTRWSLDRLPRVPDRQFNTGEVIGSMVAIAVVFVLILGVRNVTFPFLDPEAWDLGIPLLLGLLAFSFILALLKLRVGNWSYGLAIANAMMNLGFAAWWAWALGGGLLDMDYFADLVAPDWLTISVRITLAIIVAICIWDAVQGFRGARKARPT